MEYTFGSFDDLTKMTTTINNAAKNGWRFKTMTTTVVGHAISSVIYTVCLERPMGKQ